MKILKGFSLFLLLTMLLAGAMVFSSVAEAQSIYVLLIIDDANPTNAGQHKASKDKIERLFRVIHHELRVAVEISELKSNVDNDSPEFMSSDNILEWTRTVNADRGDVVFVYFSGHGGAHRTTRELYLTLPGNKLDRKVVAAAIDAIPCRLKFFITDACSFGVSINLPYINSLRRAYSNLFLDHIGFLNVAAAVEGEYALGNQAGGIFTRALVDTLEFPQELGADGFVSWEEVLELTKVRTHNYFKTFYNSPNIPDDIKKALDEVNQKSQRPKLFDELPKKFQQGIQP